MGVKNYGELNQEEKLTYKEWEESLISRKLTDQDVAQFLNQELQSAIQRLTEVNLSKDDEIFRKVEVRMIQKIQKFLDSPRVEREMIEKQIGAQL